MVAGRAVSTRPLAHWAAERARYIGALLFVIIVGLAAYHADRRIRGKLVASLDDLSVFLERRIADYEITREFTSPEILSLLRDELEQKGDLPIRLFFQLHPNEHQIAFDSRSEQIVSVESEPPFSTALAIGNPILYQTFRYVDSQLRSSWNLRLAISRSGYLLGLVKALGLWGSVAVLVWIGVDRGFFYYREATRRQHFEVLISEVLEVHGSIQTEGELVNRLPKFIRSILAFDSVAIYLCVGNRLIPWQVDSNSERERDRFLRSTDNNPIMLTSKFPEAIAARDNVSMLVRYPKRGDIHSGKVDAWTELPYVISPIFSPKRDQVIGLLTAERESNLDEDDQKDLDGLARLVAVLIEDLQNASELERLYRKVVRQSRRDGLDMVVPIIAHNMRTPLTMAEMIVRLLRERGQNLTDEERDNQLSRIGEATRRCLEQIDSIEAYRRIDHSRMRSDHENERGVSMSLDLVPFLETLEKFYASFFEIKRIRLSLESQNGFRPLVDIDQLELDQVICNLLMNAEEAFPERGRSTSGCSVKIRVKSVDGEKVLVQVEDNGLGVGAESRDQIFDENFTTKTSSKNSGVGLAYCQRVIQTAGGILKLEADDEEEGATFSITLPTKQRGQL